MKSLISYYGGKNRLACQIVPIIDRIPHTVYIEPYFGGGSVFYARTPPKVTSAGHYREVINDRSELLVNMYRVAREQTDDFLKAIALTPYARQEYECALEICANPENEEPLTLAWAYYVNINQSFNNQLGKGWRTSVSSKNVAATWDSKRAIAPACIERLRQVHIECDDALAVISRWDSPQSLFYLDPPYPSAWQGHYGGRGGWGLEDFQQLCNLLDSIQGSYVLSNYPQGDLEPASAQERIEIAVKTTAGGKGRVGAERDKSREATEAELGETERIEVLWVCDRSSNCRSDLKQILRKQSVRQLSFLE